MRALSLAVCLALVLASPARAQDACAEGRERVAGFCCWPAQTFSTDAGRCEGAPRCPAGLVEHGEACIAPVVPEPPPAGSLIEPPRYESLVIPPTIEAPPPPMSLEGWPVAHAGAVLHRPVPRHGEDGGLVAAAMVVFDLGWTMGLLVGMLDEAGPSCSTGAFFGSGPHVSCNSWPLAFIPVGGGIASGMMSWPNTPPGSFGRRDTWIWGMALGIPSVLFQGIGLIMMAVALANEVHDIGLAPIVLDGVTVSLVPAAQASDVGVSIVAQF